MTRPGYVTSSRSNKGLRCMYELNQSPPPKRYSVSRLNGVTRTINAGRNAKQHTSLGGLDGIQRGPSISTGMPTISNKGAAQCHRTAVSVMSSVPCWCRAV